MKRGRKPFDVPPAGELQGTCREVGARFGVDARTAWKWKRLMGVKPNPVGHPFGKGGEV